MPRRPSSFAKALQDAEKRLEKALVELKEGREKVFALEQEIPSLQSAIQVLQRHINPDSVTFKDSKTGKETSPSGTVIVPGIPPDLAKLAGPQDLSGMGSIPAKQLNDDELLPDPEGDALTEE